MLYYRIYFTVFRVPILIILKKCIKIYFTCSLSNLILLNITNTLFFVYYEVCIANYKPTYSRIISFFNSKIIVLNENIFFVLIVKLVNYNKLLFMAIIIKCYCLSIFY